MPEPVTLLVPIDDRYRDLAVELARKYMELAGGSAADVEEVGRAVQSTIDRLGASGGAEHVHLTLRLDSHGVEIDVRCGGVASNVTKPLPARNT